MAITYTWEINKDHCKRDLSDGFFTNVVYRVRGLDGTEEKYIYTGELYFSRPVKEDGTPDSLPSEFIPYNESAKTPNQETMIKWIKDTLGTRKVNKIEEIIKTEIDAINNPVQATGVAW